MLPNANFISWNYPKEKSHLCIYVDDINNINDVNNKNILQFKKLKNVLYSNDYHIYYHMKYLNYYGSNITHLLESDFARISLNDTLSLGNPKFLFISLYCDPLNDIKFGIFNDNNIFKWKFYEMCIINMNNKLYLDVYGNKLICSENKCKWEICENDFIKNITHDVYLSCDLNYNIILSHNINDAIRFHIKDNSIHYIKPKIKVDFEINNMRNSIDIHRGNNFKIENGINVGILLAAGTSSRFVSENNKPKQLYFLNNIPIVLYSINAIANLVDELVIVTNTKCFDEIKSLIGNYHNITLLINDVNCRLESIEIGLEYIKSKYNNVKNIIVHDSARPYITIEHIKNLLISCNTYSYSQYCLKLVNGLCKKEFTNIEMLDRDKYIEMCTPISSHFDLFYFIFINYMSKRNRIVYEHIPILNILGIKYNLIIGKNSHLKKITYIDDVE